MKPEKVSFIKWLRESHLVAFNGKVVKKTTYTIDWSWQWTEVEEMTLGELIREVE